MKAVWLDEQYQTALVVDAKPRCSLDYCDDCGDCLECCGVDGCGGVDFGGPHIWVVYPRDRQEWLSTHPEAVPCK